MKNILILIIFTGIMTGCGQNSRQVSEPLPEPGRQITFLGAEPEKTYVVIGYRNLPEDKTDKVWNNHDYIVFSYTNDQGDIKEAVVHRNALYKE